MPTETFDALTIPTQFSDLVGPIASPTTGEFQKSHGIAQRVWSDNPEMSQLEQKLNAGVDRGIQHNAAFNGTIASSTERGGSVFGTLVHRGTHVKEFDKLAYDVSNSNSFFKALIV